MRLRDLGVALDELVLMYGDHAGHPGLRALVAADGDGLTGDDVLLVPGAAAALFIVATTLLGPGSRVVVARPNYATNLETPRAIGADVAFLDLHHEDGWRVDPDRLRDLLTPETRLVSLTSPHNPTGQVIDEPTMREIVAMVEAHPRAHLLVDETYREMTFDGPAALIAGRSERAIGVSSLSKSFGLPGIRLGWITCRDRALMERFLAAKEQILITGSVVDEAIGFEALRRRDELLPPIRAGIATALDHVRGWLASRRPVRVGRAARRRGRLPALPSRRGRRRRRVLRRALRAPRHARRARPLVRSAAPALPAGLRLADPRAPGRGPREPLAGRHGSRRLTAPAGRRAL